MPYLITNIGQRAVIGTPVSYRCRVNVAVESGDRDTDPESLGTCRVAHTRLSDGMESVHASPWPVVLSCLMWISEDMGRHGLDASTFYAGAK